MNFEEILALSSQQSDDNNNDINGNGSGGMISNGSVASAAAAASNAINNITKLHSSMIPSTLPSTLQLTSSLEWRSICASINDSQQSSVSVTDPSSLPFNNNNNNNNTRPIESLLQSSPPCATAVSASSSSSSSYDMSWAPPSLTFNDALESRNSNDIATIKDNDTSIPYSSTLTGSMMDSGISGNGNGNDVKKELTGSRRPMLLTGKIRPVASSSISQQSSSSASSLSLSSSSSSLPTTLQSSRMLSAVAKARLMPKSVSSTILNNNSLQKDDGCGMKDDHNKISNDIKATSIANKSGSNSHDEAKTIGSTSVQIEGSESKKKRPSVSKREAASPELQVEYERAFNKLNAINLRDEHATALVTKRLSKDDCIILCRINGLLYSKNLEKISLVSSIIKRWCGDDESHLKLLTPFQIREYTYMKPIRKRKQVHATDDEADSAPKGASIGAQYKAVWEPLQKVVNAVEDAGIDIDEALISELLTRKQIIVVLNAHPHIKWGTMDTHQQLATIVVSIINTKSLRSPDQVSDDALSSPTLTSCSQQTFIKPKQNTTKKPKITTPKSTAASSVTETTTPTSRVTKTATPTSTKISAKSAAPTSRVTTPIVGPPKATVRSQKAKITNESISTNVSSTTINIGDDITIVLPGRNMAM
jgi:hypothetical protein